MILNKKGLMMLPLVALLFATSCAKKISYKEAVDFVNNTYTSTTPKTPTKVVGEFSGTGADDTSKDYVRFAALMFGFEELDNNLHSKIEIPGEKIGAQLPIESYDLSDSDPDNGIEITYTLKGKSLTMDVKITIEQTIPSKLSSVTVTKTSVNDQGYSTKLEFKQTTKGSIDNPFIPEAETITIDCSYNYSYTISY